MIAASYLSHGDLFAKVSHLYSKFINFLEGVIFVKFCIG